MNGFRKLQERLREEGWFVEWNRPCCQSCAWGSLPSEHEVGLFTGEKLDLAKVLFNQSQDCEVHYDYEKECEACDGEGCVGDDYEDCKQCLGKGYIVDLGKLDYEPDTSVSGFMCTPPEHQSSSLFCCSGSEEGVKNLKVIIPIIEECGCKIDWNESGGTRPYISW